MVPNRRTEEKESERGVEIRPIFLSLSVQFFGSEPYAALWGALTPEAPSLPLPKQANTKFFYMFRDITF